MQFAATLDPALLRALRRVPLDVPVADTWRELGREADRLGVARPSYACIRLHVADERLRRAERDAGLDIAARLALTRSVPLTPDGIEREVERAVRRRVRRP